MHPTVVIIGLGEVGKPLLEIMKGGKYQTFGVDIDKPASISRCDVMQEEMLHYTKFVGALDPQSGQRAIEHFEGVGMKTKLLASPEASEIAKLTETTYFGLLIAWAQEVERYCMRLGANYDEVVSFYEEIKFFPPVKYFPGEIGGHCVMPNIAILREQFPSGILQAILQSNTLKQKNFGPEGWLKSSLPPPLTSVPRGLDGSFRKSRHL